MAVIVVVVKIAAFVDENHPNIIHNPISYSIIISLTILPLVNGFSLRALKSTIFFLCRNMESSLNRVKRNRYRLKSGESIGSSVGDSGLDISAAGELVVLT